jgi:NADH-quinone oxidoreductase subunit M
MRPSLLLVVDIMAWLDLFLLPLILVIPCIGACFVGLMPPTDRISLRHLGMGCSILSGLFVLRSVWRVISTAAALEFHLEEFSFTHFDLPLVVSGMHLPVLLSIHLICPMALRAGAPRIGEQTRSYVILILIFQSFATASLICRDPLPSLFFAQLLSIPALMLLVFFGGPRKGTTALRLGIFWITADAICFASLLYLAGGESLTTTAMLIANAEALSRNGKMALAATLIASGGIRLGLVPFSSWVRDVLEQAPVSLGALVVGIILPLGGVLAFRWALLITPEGVDAIFPIWILVSLAGVSLGASLSLIERDLRAFVSAVTVFFAHIAFMGLVSRDPQAVSHAMALLCITGLAGAFVLFLIDALERRIHTRDITELNGLATQSPILWRLFILAQATLIGIPLLGTGMVFGPTLVHIGRAVSVNQGNIFSWNGVAYLVVVGCFWVMIFAAFSSILRRTLMPRPKGRDFVGLSKNQSMRLWFPAWVVIVLGFCAPWAVSALSASYAPSPSIQTDDPDTPNARGNRDSK